MNRTVFAEQQEVARALQGHNGTVGLVVANGIGEEVPQDEDLDDRRNRRPTTDQRGYFNRGGHPRLGGNRRR